MNERELSSLLVLQLESIYGVLMCCVASLPSSQTESRYAVNEYFVTRDAMAKSNTDPEISVDWSAISSQNSRSEGKPLASESMYGRGLLTCSSYKLAAIKMVTPSKEHLEEHYKDLSDKPFFKGLVTCTSHVAVLSSPLLPVPQSPIGTLTITRHVERPYRRYGLGRTRCRQDRSK